MRTSLRVLLLLTAALGMPGPAKATAFCEVKATPDGFVTLRADAGVSAAPTARMAAGDEVMLLGEKRGGWVRVRWWRGDERLRRGFAKPRGEGWVRAALLDVCG